MDRALQRFVGLLRLNGLSVSPAELMDALRGLTCVPLSSREMVRTALATTLIKDARSLPLFDDLFDAFFSIEDGSTNGADHHHHHHGDDDEDEGVSPTSVTLSEEPAEPPGPDHSHETPAGLAKYFDEKDLRRTEQQSHKEGSRIDLTAMSQELTLASGNDALERAAQMLRHELRVRRLRNVTSVGDLAVGDGEVLDGELSVSYLDEVLPELFGDDLDDDEVELLRSKIEGAIANLPELLRRYLEKAMALQEAAKGSPEPTPAYRTVFSEDERRQMDAVLRRLARTLEGALSQRRVTAARGRIHAARTMRANMRYGGLPFRPVVVAKRQDRPRLIVLVDVSLSVRNTARFALHLVHSLQSFFSKVRTFAFVAADMVEVTQYFQRCELEEALGLIFSGEVLDVDANSNYGAALETFHRLHLESVNRRTTILVIGDGRGNGNPAQEWVLDDLRRRARQLVWLNPEQRGMWHLGMSDMPTYAEFCDRVEIVRDLAQLEAVAGEVLRRC